MRCRFASFEVDFRSRELRKDGVRIRLTGQPFRILELLVAAAGEVVTRDELRQDLWSADTFVDFEHNLNSAVKRLRAALGDAAETPRFVGTVPRVGYRLLVAVVVEPGPARSPVVGEPMPQPAPALEAAPVPAAAPAASSHAALVSGFVAAAALLVAVGVFLALPRAPAAATGTPVTSVGVLPFQNLSGAADHGSFVEGLTEAVRNGLAQIQPLRVISPASAMPHDGAPLSAPDVFQRLGVDAVVDGAVVREGDRVRISARLVHAKTRRHLWTQIYDEGSSSALALQSRVAREIVREVRAKLSPRETRLTVAAHADPDLHELYLKGRHLLNRRTESDLSRALEYFEAALQRDPNYAQAHAGVAAVWVHFASWPGNRSPRDSYPKAKAAALTALALDDTLVEALTSLAFIHETFDKDFPAAERAYRRAITLNPSFALAHQRYATHLLRTGRQAEALPLARLARDLDPLSIDANVVLGQTLLAAGDATEALERLLGALELDPNYFDVHVHLGEVYERLGRPEDAVAAAERGVELSRRSAHALQALALIHARLGHRAETLALIQELETHPTQRNSYDIAMIHLALAQNERALSWLGQACLDRSPALAFLKTAQSTSTFDAVRDDSRFREVLRCVDSAD